MNYSITLTETSYPDKFKELIIALSENERVVFLIDEYDKPIIDYIENMPQAEENREILKNFYSIIKHFDYKRNAITLDFPNQEVARSFSIHLLAEMNGGKADKTNSILYDLTIAMEQGRIDDFMEIMKSLFKGIAYPLADNKEKYYHFRL